MLCLHTLCFYCFTLCIFSSEPDSHRETGPATPTRGWVCGKSPRTSGRFQMLSILLASRPPLRSATPNGRERIVSCCQRTAGLSTSRASQFWKPVTRVSAQDRGYTWIETRLRYYVQHFLRRTTAFRRQHGGRYIDGGMLS